ncbi:Bug family tripartite tricarboxylate transporter substrate binding protein [Pararhizobium haloflavum]|uniref:Bug family tripartite tricarboxylate transporter substrate binding protein n=1 Tax=Pararhizobium haloflavum TaxID=2037914 RepID=UPI0012FFDD8F|nr:tripartite tricarboxylate transporter substrate binding protein [Pararhizobium haloflavum]
MRLTTLVLTASALAVTSGIATAQEFPEKDIRFVAWSAAGSPLDTMMRQLGRQLSEELGVEVPVENRTGGSGAVAMSYVMTQPADGYTVLSTTASMTFTMAKGDVPFTPDNFTVLRALQAEPSAVAVRADSELQDMGDFVEYLQENPNGMSIGGYASAGFHQFVFYRLQQEGEFEASWVPFDGGNEAALALLGGHIDAAVLTPSSATAQLESGEFRLLGISTDERDEYFPDTPTFKEQGLDVVESIWRGVMVKEGTPDEVIDRLIEGIAAVEKSEEWQEFMQNNMQSRLDLDLEEMQEQVRAEVESRRTFLKDNGYLD